MSKPQFPTKSKQYSNRNSALCPSFGKKNAVISFNTSQPNIQTLHFCFIVHIMVLFSNIATTNCPLIYSCCLCVDIVYMCHFTQLKDKEMFMSRETNFTSFGVWLSAILCPSNRNRSVLAGTPWKRQKSIIPSSSDIVWYRKYHF